MPSAPERIETIRRARAIVTSVVDDAAMPTGLEIVPIHDAVFAVVKPGQLVRRADAEAKIFELAQLLVLLADAAKTLADASDHCRLCSDCGDGPCCAECGAEAAANAVDELLYPVVGDMRRG